MQHPKHVVTFSVVRDSDRRIFSVATFSALRRSGRRDFAFKQHHQVFRGGDTGDPLAEMRRLVPATALLIGEALVAERSRSSFDDEQFLLTAGPPADPAAPLDSPLLLLRNCETRIQGLAEAFGIPMAALDDPLDQQARRLPDRAQALWLAWAITHHTGPHQRLALAAFRAWRALEDARPMPF